MTILDRYILRHFLINFVILLFVVAALFIVIDLMFDLDEFVAAAQQRAAGRESAFALATGMLWAMGDYHGPVLVMMYVSLSGLLVVAAAGFTLNGLTRSGELVAMITSGISTYRITAPLLVVGIGFNALALPMQEYLIPPLAHKLARSKSHLKQSPRSTLDYQRDGQGNLLTASSFDPERQILKSLVIRQVAAGRIVRQITADEGYWDATRGGWILVQGHAIEPMQQAHPDHRSPPGGQAVAFFSTDLTPEALMVRRQSQYLRLLSLTALRQLAQNPNVDRRQTNQIIHSRFSLLVVNALILVMGTVFFVPREPSNLLRQSTKAAGLCMATFFAGMLLIQLGMTYLPNAVVAAWLPVVVYLPLAAGVLLQVKT